MATDTQAIQGKPPENRILTKMLDRLFAALINGPSLNCRPHSSRQRIDLTQLAKLKDQTPEAILRALLGPERAANIVAKVPVVKQRAESPHSKSGDKEAKTDVEKLSPEEIAARQAFSEQQSVFTKLRAIAEDSRTFENDTGVHVLQIGFPLLSLPTGAGGGWGLTRRIMAPLAFVSVGLSVKSGVSPSIGLSCQNHGVDLVVPNLALLSWLEKQTGQAVGELFSDEEGEKPWVEIIGIARRVCEILKLELPACFNGEQMPEDFKLLSSPRAEDEESTSARIIPAAVVGLYPMANQGLLRDMQALVDGEPTTGPIESFIKLGVSLEQAKPEPNAEAPVEKRTRTFAGERLISIADPCQARAVRLARTSRGLVVHGPPGTGKSQTIANIIGDSLARGERVLFVCDKRTALEVVMNRLQGMGLGSLCGIVHDPQRDQRELYKSIREQLDGLADLKSDASADGKLGKIDAELQRLHGELTEYHSALMKRPDKDALSFHELMGRWLAVPTCDVQFDPSLLESADHLAVEQNAQAISDLCDRAEKVGYPANPWTGTAGLLLEEYLTTPVDLLRRELQDFLAACKSADAVIDPAIPPLLPNTDLAAVAAARTECAASLEQARSAAPVELKNKWASLEAGKVGQAVQILDGAATHARNMEAKSLDRELLTTIRDAMPTIGQIAGRAAALDAYVASTKSVLGFLAFGKKSAAAKVLAKFGLQLSADYADRISAFLGGLKSRLLVREALRELSPEWVAPAIAEDGAVVAAFRIHQTLLHFIARVRANSLLADVVEIILRAFAAAEEPTNLLRGLRATTARVAAIGELKNRWNSKLFNNASRQTFLLAACAGNALGPTADRLSDRFDSLENVLRVRHGLEELPAPLKAAVARLLDQNISGDLALSILRKASDANEISRRVKSNRLLLTADGQQLQSNFTRYQRLDGEKRTLARHSILHHWSSKQKERLLAATGSRLNGVGADLRRRLTIRGQKAMRLRQVVHVGQNIEGGDPLFDLRPVWLASPETVAQVFPRAALFDVVVFDEASQCRLEEALPVLLRAKRVVIAGDPKQLPPTRFFESAVAASEDEEIESDQDLFETQQGEIEDLLAAALNIEIEECYLDVHYRSRNSDLIEFSNEKFYNSRLQAIPGHPRNRTQFPPLSLYKVGGTYEKRTNVVEAEKVCQIVRDLLKRAQPPSIGIACFNITQRDLILEKLEALAGANTEFGSALATARERKSASSFEGLFVKNLENVQGDERDHMIISTTYGPDPRGTFYRRFGPIGSAGGGRRLNVLVTRARDEVHLVTSIPETVYRNLPPIPAGETPGGAWLLFSYLVYAEKLAHLYEAGHQQLQVAQAPREPVVNEHASRFPSHFSQQYARQLRAEHAVGSDVHWGNDGFCVDLALHHPQRSEDMTIGVLCDMNRFEQAADPVEWEVFRTAILEGQRWKFSRMWTPHFFRDEQAATQAVLNNAEKVAAADDPNTLRTLDT